MSPRQQYPRHRDPDTWIARLGCLLTSLLVVVAIAWWSFVVWAIFTLVTAVAADAETFSGDPHQPDRTIVVHVDQALLQQPALVRQINDEMLAWNRAVADKPKLPRIVEAKWTSTNCSELRFGVVEVCARRWGPPPAFAGYASSRTLGDHLTGGHVFINLDQLGICHSNAYVWRHEWGHILGLAHNEDDPSSVMSNACASLNYTPEDWADLARLYH